MPKVTSTKKILILLTLLFIALLAAYAYVFWKIKSINENISILQNKIEFDQDKDSVLNAVKSIIVTTEDDRNKLDSYIVGNKNIVDLFVLIEGIAKSSGVSITIDKNISEIGKKSDSASVSTIRLSLHANGRWEDMYQFMSRIETIPYKAEIISLSMNQEDTLDTTGAKPKTVKTWRGTFDLSVLKFK